MLLEYRNGYCQVVGYVRTEPKYYDKSTPICLLAVSPEKDADLLTLKGFRMWAHLMSRAKKGDVINAICRKGVDKYWSDQHPDEPERYEFVVEWADVKSGLFTAHPPQQKPQSLTAGAVDADDELPF